MSNPPRSCPHCRRPISAGWRHSWCPGCARELSPGAGIAQPCPETAPGRAGKASRLPLEGPKGSRGKGRLDSTR